MMDSLNHVVGNNNDVTYMKLLDKKFPIIYCNQNQQVNNVNDTSAQSETKPQSTPNNNEASAQTVSSSNDLDTQSTNEMESSTKEVMIDDHSPTVDNSIKNMQTIPNQSKEQENKEVEETEGGRSTSVESTSVEKVDATDENFDEDLLAGEISDDILEMALAVEEDADSPTPKFKYEAAVNELSSVETDLKSENNDGPEQLDSVSSSTENSANTEKTNATVENEGQNDDSISDGVVKSETDSSASSTKILHESPKEPKLPLPGNQSTDFEVNAKDLTLHLTKEPSLVTQGNDSLQAQKLSPSKVNVHDTNNAVVDDDQVENISDHGANSGEDSIHDTQDTETREDPHSTEPIDNVNDQVPIPHEFLDDTPVNSLTSISSRLNVLDYAQSEWKGTTFKANCMRKGYQKLIQATGCQLMRQIRGDNYCALRATSYQVLSQNVGILKSCPNRDDFLTELPNRLVNMHKCAWVKNWSFADRLPSTPEQRVKVMENCMSFLAEQLNISDGIENPDDRQSHFSALFNSGSLAEIKLFEALKLLMLEKAIELHTLNSKGAEVPVFAWLLFARDTSEDPENFMLNHLNHAGKAGGLEQVEMFLLGQAIEVTIRVIRPSSVDQEDFITFYPDSMVEKWQQVTLIAEDDRHYNIVMN